MWKENIKQNVASLPSGAVGKGTCAECSWQIRSATLGTIFLARVFPALPSVVAQGAWQRIFFKKKPVFADGLCQGLSTQDFFKNIEKQPLPTAFARGARQRIFSKKK
jgi:hypothetical protein